MKNAHLVLFLAMLLAAGTLFAQEKRVYVNLETVFEGFYKTANASLTFEDQKKDFEARMILIRDELQGLLTQAQRLDEERRNELLPEEIRKASVRNLQAVDERLRAKKVEMDATREEGLQNLQRIRLKREDELVKDIMATVNAVADEVKADEVIEVSGKTMTRMGVFLRYPKEKEITALVLKRLNAGHEVELANAKKKLAEIRAKEQQDAEKAAEKK